MFAPILAALACTSGPAGPPPDTGPDTAGDTAWPPPDPSTYATSLPDAAALAALLGEDRDAKYTAPIEGRAREAPLVEDIYVQDMVAWPWHLQFLRAFPELRDLDLDTYTAWVVANDTRRWWGGELRLWPGTPHPTTGVPGVLSVTFWADASGDGPTVAHVAEVMARVAEVAPWAAALAAWVPDGDPQRALAAADPEALAAAGVPWVSADFLVDPLPASVLAEGTGEGVLRIGAASDGEILVADAVPADCPALAGLVVAAADAGDPAVQALAARGVPVAVAGAAVGNAVLQALAGARVRVTASGATVDLLPLRPESSP